MSDELVDKLRKAGIKASLVHRIQDETVIEYAEYDAEAIKKLHGLLMEGSGVGFDVPRLPAPEEFKGFEIGELSHEHFVAPRTTPTKSWFWFDYTARSILTKGEEARYERIAKELIELAKTERVTNDPGFGKFGYVETPNGSRRNFSKRDMGHNDPLR